MIINRTLIIDDEEDTEVLVRVCMHAQWANAVLEMYDPKCGIPGPELDWTRYDLLLLDYNLGEENDNGLNWLKKLIRMKHLPPVILLTSFATDKLSKQARIFGADEFIDKANLNPALFAKKVYAAFDSFKKNRKSFQENLIDEEKTRVIKTESTTPSTPAPDEKTQVISEEEMRTFSGDAREHTETTGSTTTRTGITAASKRATQASDIDLVVPGYRLQKKIGEGGMASIYLAESEEDGANVVLKVLSLKENGSTNLLRRFMREYKLIAQVEHENIVQIHERAFASDFAYIAMEYFKYGDLAERLKTSIDADTAISYLKQIASGLGAAHEKGIVHRDMKPANVLFRTEHSLAVTDFGIAKTAGEDELLNKQLTLEGELMGTIYYISPEQIEGAEADQRSDIYSLGVIMYKILTGKHPFTGKTHSDVFEAHLNAPIPKLPESFKNLQPLLDGLLAKDPDERFQSTEDLIMGLDWQ